MNLDIEKIVREYIEKSIHMSMATSKNNIPWVCEVHFVYDDTLNLYFRSRASTRHGQEIAANPKVAGDIVRQHEFEDYPHGIYFEGSAELIENDDQHQIIYQLFKDRFGLDERIVEEAKLEDGHKFYRVTVYNWYAFGKFGENSGKKYQLKWNGRM